MSVRLLKMYKINTTFGIALFKTGFSVTPRFLHMSLTTDATQAAALLNVVKSHIFIILFVES
jgi:hypothetical protein